VANSFLNHGVSCRWAYPVALIIQLTWQSSPRAPSGALLELRAAGTALGAAPRERAGRQLTRAWRGCRGILPLGQSRKDWNFSLQDKRVLNFENEVSDSDNIKQDISIDVYGRKE
jgi:hypothetical protein